MSNCLSCKYRNSTINNLVGCDKKKKIITNPYETKSCYESFKFTDIFNGLFNKGMAYGQS